MKRKYFKRLIATVATIAIAMSMTFVPTSAAIVKSRDLLDYGAGSGINWPKQVNAPYVDMVDYYTKEGWSINGVIKLLKINKDTGVKYFNLAFIQSRGTVSNGKVDWGWGGYRVLSEEVATDPQYKGIKQSIKELREVGGDVAISFGGANGVAFWQTTQDVDTLANTYIDIIDGYNLTRIDLDVEAGGVNKEHNIANAKAIKKVQDVTGVDVVLTLPVLPDGLTSQGLGILEAYLANGVNLKVINIMTMCYGAGTLRPGENYGSASLRAVESLKDQLKDYYKKYANTTLNDAQAFAKIGTTVSIGYESGSDPIFTTQWSKDVVNHANEKAIGMTSFWSMNRDSKLQANVGVNTAYEFTEVFKKFAPSGEIDPIDPTLNTAPIINGVSDKTITIGSSFDKLSGVTATDKEDGILTSKIVVSGNVNTQVVGKYELTYSVKDSHGVETVVKAVITVQEKPIIEDDTYDKTQIYLKGDTVIYKGATYRAKWWTQGDIPGENEVWEKIKDAPEEPNEIIDLANLASRYNKKSGESEYDLKYDLNSDGSIDIFDIVLVAKKMA